MALHGAGINIPMQYQFLRAAREWNVGNAEVLGWSDAVWKARGATVGSSLPPVNMPSLPQHSVLPTVRLRVSVQEYGVGSGYLPVKLNYPESSSGPLEIDVYASELSDILDGRTPENSPELILPHFRVIASPPISISAVGSKLVSDPWAMRGEFLELPAGDNASLAAFLRKWGRWGSEHVLRGTATLPNPHEEPTLLLLPGRVWSFQKRCAKSLAGTARDWFRNLGDARTLFPGASITPDYPSFLVRQEACEWAINDTITVGHLNAVRHRFCKNPNCGKLYRLESEHKSLYCSTRCGTNFRVRKHRRRPKAQG